VFNDIGGISLKQKVTLRDRDELEAKMAEVFGNELKELSTELQEILIDDMVTAFENRLKVFNTSNVGSGF
jgi:hypothetical protein